MHAPSYRLKLLMTMFLVAAALLLAPHAQAQGDGPRAYQLLPDGTRVASLYALSTSGNQSADPGIIIRDARIDVYLGVLQYVHTVAFNGQQTALFGVLPFGRVEGELDLRGTTLAARSSGMADAQLGAIVGLIGSPALAPQAYFEHTPGFALGVLGKLYVPTGEYDAAKAVNLGANRWGLQLGLPMAQYLGKSLLDPALTTFEFLPSVTFYSPNSDPFNADTSRQSPILRLEGHVTRNLGPALWISADGLYVRGGETTTDGVEAGNSQRALMLGATVNLAVSRNVFFKLSYGEVVSRNDNGPDGRMVRLISTVAF